jgi:phosphoglycerate dehydrogenase-like enzyme
MRRLRGLFVLNEQAYQLTYGPEELRDIQAKVDLVAPLQTAESVAEDPAILSDVEILLSGWGGPRLDEAFLAAAPALRACFYAAGSLSSVLSDAVWKRKIAVTSAMVANAVPVAEYTVATILFSLKHGWKFARQVRERRTYRTSDRDTAPGCYGSTVGLISLGSIGRNVLELLEPFDVNVLVYDPFLTPQRASALGVESVSLEELFSRSDVVSLHTPQLAETEGLITGAHFGLMKPSATFINTARAAVVRQDDMIRFAASRPDLQFVLDVASPEPPEPDSPLYQLPNVVLTPHIAGSVGNECRRMGRFMVHELERFVTGQPLQWAVTAESIQYTSHRPVFSGTVPANVEACVHSRIAAQALEV